MHRKLGMAQLFYFVASLVAARLQNASAMHLETKGTGNALQHGMPEMLQQDANQNDEAKWRHFIHLAKQDNAEEENADNPVKENLNVGVRGGVKHDVIIEKGLEEVEGEPKTKNDDDKKNLEKENLALKKQINEADDVGKKMEELLKNKPDLSRKPSAKDTDKDRKLMTEESSRAEAWVLKLTELQKTRSDLVETAITKLQRLKDEIKPKLKKQSSLKSYDDNADKVVVEDEGEPKTKDDPKVDLFTDMALKILIERADKVETELQEMIKNKPKISQKPSAGASDKDRNAFEEETARMQLEFDNDEYDDDVEMQHLIPLAEHRDSPKEDSEKAEKKKQD
eukprot:gene14157-15635_t